MRRGVLLVLAVALVVAASFCVVVLDEREQAFRTLLSEADYTVAGIALNRPELTEPGWYIRIPMLHELYVYDRRLQRYDSDRPGPVHRQKSCSSRSTTTPCGAS